MGRINFIIQREGKVEAEYAYGMSLASKNLDSKEY